MPSSSPPNVTSSYTLLAFDADGHLTARRTRTNTGIQSDVSFTAGADGRTLTIDVNWSGSADSGGHPVTTITFDAEGHEVKSEIEVDDKTFSTTERAYDSAGRLVSETTCPGACNGSSSRTEFKYDQVGRLINEAYRAHPDSAPSWRVAYEYPAANVVRERYFGGDFIPRDSAMPESVPTRITETTNDADGRPVEIVTTMPGAQKGGWGCSECAMPGRIAIRYDKQGRVQDRTEYSPSGEPEAEDIYVYDAAGNTLSATHNIGRVQNAIKYSYDFDERGNWIRKETYRDNADGSRTIWSIEKRTVTYYQ
ncbi:MAG TPA: hypothetical protein VFO34_16795 [Candidatus Acidoferrales bacterium]|nr:hypothetical protein [Candidatus Acidoferrales bacterium]